MGHRVITCRSRTHDVSGRSYLGNCVHNVDNRLPLTGRTHSDFVFVREIRFKLGYGGWVDGWGGESIRRGLENSTIFPWRTSTRNVSCHVGRRQSIKNDRHPNAVRAYPFWRRSCPSKSGGGGGCNNNNDHRSLRRHLTFLNFRRRLDPL